MKVHLLRDPEFDCDEYKDLLDFLNSFDGPISFFATEAMTDGMEAEVEQVDPYTFFNQLSECSIAEEAMPIPKTRLVARWKDLFSNCERYRRNNLIHADEMVILLTPYANENNWFSASDPNTRNNGFVHTHEWAHYVMCPSVFPIAYLVASLILQSRMFTDMAHLKRHVHFNTLGCFNDFCENKKEILLKLRTADICTDCISLLKDHVSVPAINQVQDIFEGVRKRILFVQNFRQRTQPSTLVVKNFRNIYLSDYGNVEIKLTPLERTVYFFFLNHPEGVALTNLCDHRDELVEIYSRLSKTGLMADIHNRVKDICDVTSNSASEKISKVKQKFTAELGEELAEHYIIKGADGGRKGICLDRDLVEMTG